MGFIERRYYSADGRLIHSDAVPWDESSPVPAAVEATPDANDDGLGLILAALAIAADWQIDQLVEAWGRERVFLAAAFTYWQHFHGSPRHNPAAFLKGCAANGKPIQDCRDRALAEVHAMLGRPAPPRQARPKPEPAPPAKRPPSGASRVPPGQSSTFTPPPDLPAADRERAAAMAREFLAKNKRNGG